MKKIAYIEIDTHAEIAQSFIDISKDSEIFSVDYYFSKKIKNLVNEDNENVFLSDSSMILEQLKSKNYDLVVIGTVHRYFNTFLEVSKNYKTAIIVHNLNFTKISRFQLFQNIFKEDLIFRLKLLWKEGLFNSSKVYQNAKSLLVLDEEMALGEINYLPLFFTKNFEKKQSDIFRVVIPGGVSQKRRDYDRVFAKIKEIDANFDEKSHKSKLIEFVFLGKAKGSELKKIIDLERSLKMCLIQYFKERVSSDEFKEKMQSANVLWCPIQNNTRFLSQIETYGKTKMTGNIGDAIHFGKVAVFPKNYKTNLEFVFAENEDLLTQFEYLSSKSYDFSLKYNKKTVLGKLEQLIIKLIST